MWKDVIELGNIAETIVYNEPVQSLVYRQVYANKKSVWQSEVYLAAQVGLKPKFLFEVNTFEFDNDEKVRYNGKVYDITRVYENGDITELTVSALIGEV